MLTDGAYAEEFDITVDELTDQYVAGGFQGEERERLEQYFFKSAERRDKLKFALALSGFDRNSLDTASVLADLQPHVLPAEPAWTERFCVFWNKHHWTLQTGTALAAMVILVAVVWVVRDKTTRPHTFTALTLSIVDSNRGNGATGDSKVRFPLSTDALKISLRLPNPQPQGARYRAELLNANGGTNSLPISEQNAEEVSVVIPASQLQRGQYAIRLFAILPNGVEQRIPGHYFFTVE